MEYRGFEVYATQVPVELASNGAGNVFSCEVYRVEDDEMRNVLAVFDLVEGMDIPVGADEALVAALRTYVDKHYDELISMALRNEREPGAIVMDSLAKVNGGRITRTANAQLCFDENDGHKVVCVDFIYDNRDELPVCDVVNLLTMPATEENVELARVLLWALGEKFQVPVHDGGAKSVAVKPDEKLDVMKVYEKLLKLQEMPGYQIAAVMAAIQDGERFEALSNEDAFTLASKFETACGSWFSTTVLHAEYLEALLDLLESGVNERNAPIFPEMTPADTLTLLLTADNQVFGTLVEAAAVQSAYQHAPYDYGVPEEDRQAVFRAAGRVKYPVRNISDVISQAVEKAENGTGEKNKIFEKVMD